MHSRWRLRKCLACVKFPSAACTPFATIISTVGCVSGLCAKSQSCEMTTASAVRISSARTTPKATLDSFVSRWPCRQGVSRFQSAIVFHSFSSSIGAPISSNASREGRFRPARRFRSASRCRNSLRTSSIKLRAAVSAGVPSSMSLKKFFPFLIGRWRACDVPRNPSIANKSAARASSESLSAFSAEIDFPAASRRLPAGTL